MKEKVKNIFKGYWYWCGQWHKADCDCIRHDQGVCNCQTGKNREAINKRLDKLFSKPLKVDFYKK